MSAKTWLDRIQKAEKKRNIWVKKGRKIVKRYRDDRSETDDSTRYNILWSNTETIKPALYAKTPKPVIDRRHKDKDPVGIAASKALERAIEYHLDAYDFDGVIKSVTEDYLLPGLGTARVKYVPSYGDEVKEDAEGKEVEPYAPVDYEEAQCVYVFWEDFLHGPGRKWEEVPWIAFKAYLTRNELTEKWPDKGSAIPLDYKEEEDSEGENDKATVYEIWDKRGKRVLWLAKGHDEVMEQGPPPLSFSNFWPCPKPVWANKTNDSLIPVSLYHEYQDLAIQLDTLTERISVLSEALKMVGAYAGEQQATLEQMLSPGGENKLIPVDSWSVFAEKGGIKGLIEWMPVEQVAGVLISLHETRERVKQDVYEITGISDLIRGVVDPREKAAQSRIKANYAGQRIGERTKEISRFVRDLLELKAEVIAEQFSAKTLQIMTGVQIPKQVIELLRNDPIRSFRIDIETDSTIEPDQQAEKEQRIEFLTASTAFLEKSIEIGGAVPQMMPLLGEMLMFGVRGFTTSRDLESSFEDAIEAIKNPPEGTGDDQGDPIKEAELQLKAQTESTKAQIEQEKLALSSQVEQGKLALETQKTTVELQAKSRELQIKEQELAIKAREQAVKEAEASRQAYESEKAEAEMTEQELQALQTIVETSQATAQAAVESANTIMQAIAEQAQATQAVVEMMAQVGVQLTAPKRLIRDEQGRPVGVETVSEALN